MNEIHVNNKNEWKIFKTFSLKSDTLNYSVIQQGKSHIFIPQAKNKTNQST